MTERIFIKLLLTFFGLLAVAALGVEYLVTEVTENNLREELTRELEQKARLAESVLRNVPPGEYAAAVDEIAERSSTRVTAIRRDGSVVGDSQANPRTMENHASRPEFVEALDGRVGVQSRFSQTVGIDLLYVAVPTREGALRVALPLHMVQARTTQIRNRVLQVTLLAMIPAVFLAAWISRRISSQLSQIINFSRQLAQGNFQAPQPGITRGELGEMGRTLTTTAGQLRSMFEQLQDERSRFAAAVNGIGEGILVADRKRRSIVLSNPAMVKMFPNEPLAPGASLDEWSHHDIPELFSRVFADGSSCSVDLTIGEPEPRSWKVSCAPIISRKGKVQAVVAVFYDITELETLDRMRKDFVINVSHELRTPLASIQGYAETLLDGAIDDPKIARRFVRILAQNAERLAQLTADLMTLSQIEVSTREFHFSPHSVVALLGEATDAIRAITEKKEIHLVVEPVREGLELPCDSSAVQQMLNNLLDNAVKYTPEGGTITVGARELERDVEFFVKDTGIGIAPEHIPRLFERFYRVDKARSRALGGTGLGLAIVKHLVIAHQGTVRVESEVGKGSTFCFRIPSESTVAQATIEARQGVLF
jgi:two-component system phosphate regulon sensor histidine kinase PhoR